MSQDHHSDLRERVTRFLAANPNLRFVDAFVTDLNGVLRGKRLRADSALKVFDGKLRLPLSIVATDIWGGDVKGSSLLFESGDRDGACVPTGTGLLPVPWAQEPTAQVLAMMRELDGTAFHADARQQLVDVLARCAQRDLAPVVAFEFEFSLFAAELDDLGRPALPPSTGKARRVQDGRIYAMAELDEYGAFFADLYTTCEQQELPLDTAIVESGPGQFELNLAHQANALLAADHAVLLRRAVKGVAAKHNLLASFMAKPFAELPGNGMHVHLSLLGPAGSNVFDDGSAAGSATLRQAVAGLLASAPEAMIFFAPHLNSMRRFRALSHAPTRASWGHDNRTVAVRIPVDQGVNKRLEHRVAGADANPYLVLSAILQGILHGVDHTLEPPPPVEGNGYEAAGTALDADWSGALERFTAGEIFAPAFGPLFTRVYSACKRQEQAVTAARITDFEYDTHLRAF